MCVIFVSKAGGPEDQLRFLISGRQLKEVQGAQADLQAGYKHCGLEIDSCALSLALPQEKLHAEVQQQGLQLKASYDKSRNSKNFRPNS
jgi:hypothetical protein